MRSPEPSTPGSPGLKHVTLGQVGGQDTPLAMAPTAALAPVPWEGQCRERAFRAHVGPRCLGVRGPGLGCAPGVPSRQFCWPVCSFWGPMPRPLMMLTPDLFAVGASGAESGNECVKCSMVGGQEGAGAPLVCLGLS